jgi:hypothetical protein
VALAVLLVGAAASVVALALSAGPSFIAGAVTEALDRHVSIGSIQVRAGLAMYVDLTDVRIHQTKDPASPVLLEAPRAQGRQLWPRVIVGQFVPISWSLEDPIARVDLKGGKGGKPEIPPFDLAVRGGRLELATSRGDFVIDGLGLRAERGVLLPTARPRAWCTAARRIWAASPSSSRAAAWRAPASGPGSRA